jgi:hypothetical protein
MYETMYRAQFISLKMFVKLHRLVVALEAETCSAMSYCMNNKLIVIQWVVNEVLIVLCWDRDKTKKFIFP